MKSRFLSNAEICRIFERLSPLDRVLFEVALQTGLRIGDVVKIKKSDISQFTEGACEISFVAEKTGKRGKATVHGFAAARLAELLHGTDGYIFPTERHSRSGHITRQTVWSRFKKAAEFAGVPLDGCSPHSLRKSFAVALRHEKGIAAAQKALQHSNSAVTALYAYADAYAGCDPDAPITWAQVSMLVDLVIAQLNTKKAP